MGSTQPYSMCVCEMLCDVKRSVESLLVMQQTLLRGKLNSTLLTKLFQVHQGVEHGSPAAAHIPIPTAAEERIISAYETLGRNRAVHVC